MQWGGILILPCFICGCTVRCRASERGFVIMKEHMRKKLDNMFQKAFEYGILPKGFSRWDFDSLCRCLYEIDISGYAETIDKKVADYLNKNGYAIIDWSEPQYADKDKIGFRIME